jgi:hypothetical protein
MFARLIRISLSLWAAALVFTACEPAKTSRPGAPAAATNAPAPALSAASAPGLGDLSTLHWLGRERLAADTNATAVMTLWNLPESAALGAQTLDQLALAPWRLLQNDTATNGAPVALLRPLLADLVTAESHWEFHHPPAGPASWALAIKLPPARAALWQTNLAAVLASLTGVAPVSSPAGFVLNTSPAGCELLATNGWTLLRFGPRPPTFDLTAPATNWLTLSLDLAALNRAFGFGWTLPANCPRVDLDFSGDGQSVSTRGLLTFATPPAVTLPPWNIPTNLIHDPLTSFTACRAGAPLLGSLPVWKALELGAPPEQFYTWSQMGMPFQTYFAASVADVSNRLAQLGARMVAGNPWLRTNGLGQFTNAPEGRVLWDELMIMEPWLAPRSLPGGDWLAGGFFPLNRTNRPAPAELLAQFSASPTIVYYDWEITEQRVQDWLYIGQLLRLALHQSQVPPPSVGIKWLTTLGLQLGNCGTVIQRTAPTQFTLSRRSSLGLSAAELHLLTDWLESPRFPVGLHTYLARPDDFIRRNMQKMAQRAPLPVITNAPVSNAPAPATP